jgi:hypothetical protein
VDRADGEAGAALHRKSRGAATAARRVARWTAEENSRLRGDVDFVALAGELGRTEEAIRKKRNRQLSRFKRYERRSIAEVARRSGYHRSVVESVSRRLGHRWLSNGLTGSGARYFLRVADAEAVLAVLAARWSRDATACQQCGTTKVPHHARGLCARCYWPSMAGERGRNNRWSLTTSACQWCGTDKAPHHSRGLCRRCYRRARAEEVRS